VNFNLDWISAWKLNLGVPELILYTKPQSSNSIWKRSRVRNHGSANTCHASEASVKMPARPNCSWNFWVGYKNHSQYCPYAKILWARFEFDWKFGMKSFLRMNFGLKQARTWEGRNFASIYGIDVVARSLASELGVVSTKMIIFRFFVPIFFSQICSKNREKLTIYSKFCDLWP